MNDPLPRRPVWGYMLFDKRLPRKPEVLLIVQRTGMSRGDVVLALMEFWSWVDDHYPDGRICPASVPLLSASCPDIVPGFWEALIEVGWLRTTAQGFEIPNFDTWIGSTAKKRAKESLRKWRNRQVGQVCPGFVPPEAGQKTDIGGTEATPSISEASSKNPPTPQGVEGAFSEHLSNLPDGQTSPSLLDIPLPGPIDTPDVRAWWTNYVRHRLEIRKPLTSQSVKLQLGHLAAMGPVRAVAAIEHTIRQGYLGITEPPPPKPGETSEATERARLEQERRERDERTRRLRERARRKDDPPAMLGDLIGGDA